MDLYEILKASFFSRRTAGNDTSKLTVSGYPCVLEKSAGKAVVNYRIYGNSVQNGTPTPANPVEVESVGELVTEGEFSGKYMIPVIASNTEGTTRTIPVFLDEPLGKIDSYIDVIDFSTQESIRNVVRLNLTSALNWVKVGTTSTGFSRFRVYVTHKFSNTNSIRKLSQSNRLIVTIESLQTPSQTSINLYDNWVNIFLPDSEVSTIAELKQWLDENPTYVIYIPEAPVHEPLKLPFLPTFSGTTTIETATEISPSDIEITYKSRS